MGYILDALCGIICLIAEPLKNLKIPLSPALQLFVKPIKGLRQIRPSLKRQHQSAQSALEVGGMWSLLPEFQQMSAVPAAGRLAPAQQSDLLCF